MIELKHTPGPWTVDGFNIQSAIAATKNPKYRNGLGYIPIYSVSDDQREIPLKERVANAKLIAAAPDLLRELIEFHDYMIDQDAHECDGIPGGCPVKAAITKATGLTW